MVEKKGAGQASSSRQYAAEAAHFPPLSPALYSAASFASADAINRTVDQFGKAFAMDAAYSNQYKASTEKFEQQMSKVDPQFLKSWMSSSDNYDAGEAKVFALERQWFSSVQALYKFAADNEKKYSIQKNELLFASDDAKSEFEKLESASIDLAKKMHAARASLAKEQQQAEADM